MGPDRRDQRRTGGTGPGGRGHRGALALTATIAAALGASAGAAGAVAAGRRTAAVPGGEWTTYGANMGRTSIQPLSPALRPLRRRWLSSPLDGAVYGEQNMAYLLDAARLGGVGGSIAATQVCFSAGGDAYLAPLVFTVCPGTAMSAVRVGPRSLQMLWRSPANGSPTIAAGLVWSLSGGRLVGLRPANGRELVSLPAIDTTHFAAPSAGEGLLVVAGTQQVEAFEGLRGWTGP